MKNIIIGLLIAAVIFITGCITTINTENMYRSAKSIGAGSALVVTQSHVDQVVKDSIILVVKDVESHIPDLNEKFVTVWEPVAQVKVNSLIEEAKLTPEQGEAVMVAFRTAANGIDYLFNIRYPQARAQADLVASAVHGFCDGFNTVISTFGTLSTPAIEPDLEVYDYLRK